MPGCKVCFVSDDPCCSKATLVFPPDITWELADTGEGLYCDHHAPEGARDIYEWMDEVRS